MPSGPIILLCNDLIFTAKITGTASGLNIPIRVVNSAAAAQSLINEHTAQLFVDLSNPSSTTASDLAQLRSALPSSARLLAYGSHVDVDRLNSARSAGCNPVLARSDFTKRLPELLQFENANASEP